MASGPRIKIADAYFALGVDNNIGEAIAGPMNKLEIIGGSLAKIGGTIAGVWGSIGAGIAYATDVAGRHMQQITRLSMLYSDAGASQMRWIDEYTAATKRGEVATTQMISRISGQMKGYGFDEEVTQQISRDLISMIGDLQAFVGMSMEETNQRVMAVMTGSGEAGEILALNVKQNALDAKMKELFGMTTAQGATEAMKVIARMAVIEEALERQKALGYDVYADTYPKALAITKDSFTDLAAAIGQSFVPVAKTILKYIHGITRGLADMAEKNPWLVRGFVLLAGAVTLVGIAIAGVGLAMVALSMVVVTLGPWIVAAFTALAGISLPLLALVAVVAALAAGLAALGGTFIFMSLQADSAGGAMRQFMSNMKQAWDDSDPEAFFYNFMMMAGVFAKKLELIFNKLGLALGAALANGLITSITAVLSVTVQMVETVLSGIQDAIRETSPLFKVLVPEFDTSKIGESLDKLEQKARDKIKSGKDATSEKWDKEFEEFAQTYEDAAKLLGGEYDVDKGWGGKNGKSDAELSMEEIVKRVKEMAGIGTGKGSMSPIKAADFRTVAGQEAAYANQLSVYQLMEQQLANQKENTDANKRTADAVTQPAQPALQGV